MTPEHIPEGRGRPSENAQRSSMKTKTLMTILMLVLAGCTAPAPQPAATGSAAEGAIRRYVFLHLSDQRPSLQSSQEIEVTTAVSNDSLVVTVPQPVIPPTPNDLTVGGIPIEKYRRETQGNRVIFIDPDHFPETDHAFIFPAGGWPHWFSLTIDSITEQVIDHHRPSTM